MMIKEMGYNFKIDQGYSFMIDFNFVISGVLIKEYRDFISLSQVLIEKQPHNEFSGPIRREKLSLNKSKIIYFLVLGTCFNIPTSDNYKDVWSWTRIVSSS